MSTKPTREQDRGCTLLARSLLLITEAARLDGPDPINRASLIEVARGLARASTAFDLDAILARALEARGDELGLRSGTAELLTLIEEDVDPLSTLLLSDVEFRAVVARAEAELGEV